MDVRAAFAAELVSATPEGLALVIAQLRYPELDMALALRELDDLATVMGVWLEGVPAGRARAEAFVHVFCRELGYHGNQNHYHDPDNSYLNKVLERRVGLPITLSVVCMAIGRRLGLHIDGLNLPAHFMARYEDEVGAWLLDPFHAAVVPEAETAAYLTKLFGREITLGSDALEAVTPRDVASRMLRNLRSVYVVNRDVDMVLRLLDLLVLVEPNAAMYWQERGYLAQSLDEYETAVRSLRRAMFLSGHVPHMQPHDGVLTEPPRVELGMEQALREIEQQWVRRN